MFHNWLTRVCNLVIVSLGDVKLYLILIYSAVIRKLVITVTVRICFELLLWNWVVNGDLSKNKENVICTVHCREHASDLLLLRVRRCWPPLPSPPARHQPTLQDHHRPTLQDHEYGLMYHAMCLFSLPAFAVYSLGLPTEGWHRMCRPVLGAWFHTEVVYPSKDGQSVTHPGTNWA